MSEATLGQRQRDICAAIKAGIPAVQICEPLGMQLSTEGIGRSAAKMPAVYVACAGVQGGQAFPVGTGSTRVIWTAFLVVSDAMEPTTATDLLERLIDHVRGEAHGSPLTAPQLERAENLFKGEAARQPLSIYAVRFSHNY